MSNNSLLMSSDENQSCIDHLSVTSSTKRLVKRLSIWRQIKADIFPRYVMLFNNIDNMRAELEQIVEKDQLKRLDVIMTGLLMEVDAVRVNLYTKLALLSNKTSLEQGVVLPTVFLNDKVHVEKNIETIVSDGGWLFATFNLSQSYDMAVFFGRLCETIQIEYIVLAKVVDDKVLVSDAEFSHYFFDGLTHVIDDIYKVSPDAIMHMSRTLEDLDSVSIQVSFRLLKARQ